MRFVEEVRTDQQTVQENVNVLKYQDNKSAFYTRHNSNSDFQQNYNMGNCFEKVEIRV
jgi:hypothetical protein